MHHVTLDRWSRGSSLLHARDARAKIVVLLLFLVAVAATHKAFFFVGIFYFALLAAALLAARLPWWPALSRAAVVLPFTLAFALVSLIAGEPLRAVILLEKSYFSALAVLLLVSTTPLPQLLAALESLRVPRYLLMVAQFLYRYLFVLSEEAQHMRIAGLAKGATVSGWVAHGQRFSAAAGALGVLFARSYVRAEGIHQAMAARGFQGHFRPLSQAHWSRADGVLVAAVFALLAGLFLLGEVLA